MEGKEVKEKDGDKQQEKNKAWLGIGFLMLSKQVVFSSISTAATVCCCFSSFCCCCCCCCYMVLCGNDSVDGDGDRSSWLSRAGMILTAKKTSLMMVLVPVV